MAAVMVEIAPPPAPADPDEVVLVDDVDALAAGTTAGCGDDNPYQ